MLWLKQSTAVTVKIGPFVDEDDGKTAETSLTLTQGDIRLSKNGGDIAQKNESSTTTHDELGIYDCDLDATDTGTLGRLQLWVHESGALPVWHEFIVVPENVYDSFFSTDMLKVDVHAIDDDETAANNAESFFDGTGYAGTGNTIPTVTTLTGHTAQTGDNYTRLGAPAGASIADDISTVDTAVDAIKLVTDMLSPGAKTVITGTVNTANTSPTTTLFAADDISETTNDHYNGRIVIFYESTDALYGQAALIEDYEWDAVNTEGKFTVSALTEAPSDDDVFVIL